MATAAALLAASCIGPARAQEGVARFELTPHAGYRFGGSFEQHDGEELDLEEGNAQGILLNIRASANTQWELLYARQETRLDTPSALPGVPWLEIKIEHLQFGGTYLFEGPVARPFLALTAGVSHFEPSVPGTSAETYFSGSLGVGVQFRANKRVGVRLEGRVFGSLIDSDEALFCSTGPEANVCAIRVVGTVLYQWEARAGVVFRF
jgi:hypothetical protein